VVLAPKPKPKNEAPRRAEPAPDPLAELARRHLAYADLALLLPKSDLVQRWRAAPGDPAPAIALAAAIRAAPIDRAFLDKRLSRVLRSLRAATLAIEQQTRLEGRFMSLRTALSDDPAAPPAVLERQNAELDAIESELVPSHRRGGALRSPPEPDP
jgi:hypothetical protein